jgi:hypothetical protein
MYVDFPTTTEPKISINGTSSDPQIAPVPSVSIFPSSLVPVPNEPAKTAKELTMIKNLRNRLLKVVGTKNSWGKNELSDLIRDQYVQILEKELSD